MSLRTVLITFRKLKVDFFLFIPPNLFYFKIRHHYFTYAHSFNIKYQKWVHTINGNNETSDNLSPTA